MAIDALLKTEYCKVSCVVWNYEIPLVLFAKMCALQLAKLDLSANFIGDGGVKAVAQALQTNTSMEYLDLHSCGIHDKGRRPEAVP